MDHPDRPRKPWYRLRNIFLAIVVLIALFVGRQFQFALTATPGSSVNYGEQLRELAESVNPDAAVDDNAAPLVTRLSNLREEALRRLAEDSPDFPARYGTSIVDFTLVGATFDPANPAATGTAFPNQEEFDRQRDHAVLALEYFRKAGVFDVASLAATKSRYVRDLPEGRLIDVVFPEFGTVRDIARANLARMHLSLQTPEQDDFARAFEDTLGLGRVMTAEPVILSNLVGMAVADAALRGLRDAVLSGALTPKTLEEIMGALERQAGFLPATHAARGEHIAALDIIQWTHTDDGHGNGRRIPSASPQFFQPGSPRPPLPSVIVDATSIFYPSKKVMTEKVDEFYANVQAYAQTPPPARLNATWHPDIATESLPRAFDLIKYVTPAMGSFIKQMDLLHADLAGARIMVAIERFRAAHGSPPVTLEELVPSLLPSLPLDRFSGQPFRYVVLSEPDADGRRYLLHSVGADVKDDNATAMFPDRSNLQRGQPRGTDLLINRGSNTPRNE